MSSEKRSQSERPSRNTLNWTRPKTSVDIGVYLSPEQTAKSEENTPHPLVSCQTGCVESHATILRYYDLHTPQKIYINLHINC